MTGPLLRRRLAQAAALAGALAPLAGSPYGRSATPAAPPGNAGSSEIAPAVGSGRPAPEPSASAQARRRGC
jgi:hypothetical protein